MRVALVYPPPWKIPRPGEPPDPVDGPPPGYRDGDLDPDFWQTPYGLYSLAAEVTRAGHPVKILNLSSYDWVSTEEALATLDADLYGLSCWTANRRGVALAADAIKRRVPRAHVVVGGPHATPLARELMAHHPAIDMVSIGESEEQLLELIARLARGAPTAGIAGTVARDGDRVVEGPRRAPIEPLDRLASPHDAFTTHIVMTSRGCPWRCTFCGAETSWGRGLRSFSEARVLDMLEAALRRVPVRMLQIKDDTFTAHRRRVLSLCRAIRARGLRFAWSCDTRADVLSEEVVRELRLAGCQRLSLGVESGSPRVLAAIDKGMTVEQIVTGTELARAVGLEVRYYLMLGNRGETAETFRETLAFLERARPHQYLFSCLSIYPGTRDFADAEAAGWLDREIFFRERFQELKVPFDAPAEDAALMNDWFHAHQGVRELYRPDVAECAAILARLGEHAPAHLDLANAAWAAGELDLAERHARRALELEHPLPGLVHNTLACIAWARGDVEGMQAALLTAARTDPQHPALIRNVQAARRWFAESGPARGLPLELVAEQGFQLLERTLQPALPGPLPEDLAEWGAAAPPAAEDPAARRRLEVVE